MWEVIDVQIEAWTSVDDAVQASPSPATKRLPAASASGGGGHSPVCQGTSPIKQRERTEREPGRVAEPGLRDRGD